MNKNVKICISIALISFFSVLIVFFGLPRTNNVIGSSTKTADIKITQKDTDKKSLIIICDFKENKPIMIVHSPQLDNIDLKSIQNQLSPENVGVKKDDKCLYLNFENLDKKSSKKQLNVKLLTSNPTELTITDIDKNILTKENFFAENVAEKGSTADNPETATDASNNDDNQEISSDESSHIAIDPEDEISAEEKSKMLQEADTRADEEAGWVQSSKLKISKGHETKTLNGDRIIPVMYFGAINYSLKKIKVKDSYSGRPLRPGLGIIPGPPVGTGRKNNITAANSAIMIVPKNGNPDMAQDARKNKNHYYTYTFGDGDLKSGLWGLTPGNNVYEGSQRNFTTSSLFQNYSGHATKDPLKPTIYGPDIECTEKVVGLDEKKNPPKFYTKSYIDSTGATMTKQRIVFDQLCNEYKLRIKITQEFLPDNSIKIHTEYINIGSKPLNDFTGYTFRDVTFMKDHDFKSRMQANVFRSLGNNQGTYSSRNAFNSRIEFDLARYNDAPFAWAGRGTKSTFLAEEDGADFPFRQNAISNNTLPDAFTNTLDTGDKEKNLAAGEPFYPEKDVVDSGLSMHTKPETLEIGKSTSMTYDVNMNYRDYNPSLTVYNKSVKENPDIVKPDEKTYKLHGNWRSHGSNNVEVKYLIKELITDEDIDSDLTDETVKNGISITNGYQHQATEPDKTIGLPHEWSTDIDLTKLNGGPHRIVVVAIDKEGRRSKVSERYFTKAEDAMAPVSMEIENPSNGQSEDDPADIRLLPNYKDDSLTFSGQLEYDPDKNNVFYYLDNNRNNRKKIPKSDITINRDTGKYNWVVNDVKLGRLEADNEKHHITFEIVSKKSENPVALTEDSFWFQHRQNEDTDDEDASFVIKPPSEIDFGVKHMAPNSEADAKANVKGQMVIEDFRAPERQQNNPITLQLETDEFGLMLPGAKNPSTKEILKSELYWKKEALTKTRSFTFTNQKQLKRIFLTDEIRKNMHLKIHTSDFVKQGKFKSTWKWTAVDSIH